MKLFRIFLFVILSVIVVSSCAALKSQKERIIIVNGYFFKELPSSLKKAPAKEMEMFMLSTPDGTKAIGISTSMELSEKTLKYSVPVDQVTEGEELLRRFNDAKAKLEGTKIVMGEMEPKVKVGDRFPDFSATDIDGRKWTNKDVEGKVMVLNLWFSGCGPCRAEMPELSTWKDEMPDVMFFSSTYESAEIARKVFEKVKFSWIPLVDDTQFMKFIGNNGYPLTLVVDMEGKIAAFEYGTSQEQRDTLKQKIQSLR